MKELCKVSGRGQEITEEPPTLDIFITSDGWCTTQISGGRAHVTLPKNGAEDDRSKAQLIEMLLVDILCSFMNTLWRSGWARRGGTSKRSMSSKTPRYSTKPRVFKPFMVLLPKCTYNSVKKCQFLSRRNHWGNWMKLAKYVSVLCRLYFVGLERKWLPYLC